MEPYVIRQGDYLTKLAYEMGFDATTVWQDGSNDDLRKERPDPDMLLPGDILYVPTAAPAGTALNIGTTNDFTAAVPTVTVSVRFDDDRFASQPFTVPELPDLTGLQTGADGTATVTAPVTLESITVSFETPKAAYTCWIGYADPLNTLSGVFQRLQNLGYLDANMAPTDDVDVVRAGLRALKAAQTNGSDGSGDAGGSGDSGGSDTSDDAGLSDDGKLDEATAMLLFTAHGH
jgi:hypothetical protein